MGTWSMMENVVDGDEGVINNGPYTVQSRQRLRNGGRYSMDVGNLVNVSGIEGCRGRYL